VDRLNPRLPGSKLDRPLDFGLECARIAAAPQFRFVDLRPDDVLLFALLAEIPEMHDRIIAGVAVRNNCECLTRDRALTACSSLRTLW